jgi:hypothetical protein
MATIMGAKFDLTDMRITANVHYRQIAVLSPSQYHVVVGWTVAGIVMSAISIVLAFNAALQVR